MEAIESNRSLSPVARYWSWMVVIALAILLWLPRLSGPIDLRWDGGVYYLLGSALASGHGYRIPSEPGAPEAVQYPPLLPAFVAMYQKIAGTTDPIAIAPRLRTFYAATFILYALAALALARQFLAVPLAVLATALSLLHHATIFFSDLLFAELPFALVSVAFAVVAIVPWRGLKQWARELTSFLLAAAGFLLRTIGFVLFIAWIAEALLRRRWKLALVRSGLALLPLVAWNVHVARVRSSDAYAHSAYQYQRAPYQYSNVTYAENASLLNPFQPELGRVSARTITQRLMGNVPWLAMGVGEALSASAETWPLRGVQARLLGRHITTSAEESADTAPIGAGNREQPFIITYALIGVPILALAMLTGFGLAILVRDRLWLMPLIVIGTLVLVWITPWRAQFTRYLMPLTPFLTICMLLGFRRSYHLFERRGGCRTILRLALVILLVICCATHVVVPIKLFRSRATNAAIFRANGLGQSPRFFAHDRSWQSWEEAANWIQVYTPKEAIVATSAPHLLYLLTGRIAVLPPMEINPAREKELLQTVPAAFAIIDQLKALDVTRRYVLPAVEEGNNWKLVREVRATRIYQNTTGAEP